SAVDIRASSSTTSSRMDKAWHDLSGGSQTFTGTSQRYLSRVMGRRCKPMSIFTSRPALRWGVPVVVFGAVIGRGAAAPTLGASAEPSVGARTAGQLLVDLQTARLDGASGTVVEQADLGLPSLPGLGGRGSSDLTSLVSGSHTMRVWYSGPDKARIALLGTLGEQDIITNGHDVWRWDSQRNTATHSVMNRDAPGKATGEAPGDVTGKAPAINPN